MATLITVHGTFAQVAETPAAKKTARSLGMEPPVAVASGELPWWRPGSAFVENLQMLIESDAGNGQRAALKVEPLEWSGDNSETERRAAAARLLDRMLQLELQQEAYCVVGHSHGGSVIASAMILAASRHISLRGLQKWISVGTPFVTLKPMPRLVDRLDQMQKVVLVASMMLLYMFLFFWFGQLLAGGWVSLWKTGESGTSVLAWRTALAAMMMSVPAVFFSIVFRVLDRRMLFSYRRSTMARARQFYGEKWLSLCHANDEAVQGMRSMVGARMQLFDRGFAVQTLTTTAIFALPVAYLLLIASPPLMLRISDFLQNNVYQVAKYTAEQQRFDQARKQVRSAAQTARVISADSAKTPSAPAPAAKAPEIKPPDAKAPDAKAPDTKSTPPTVKVQPEAEWTRVRALQDKLKTDFPDYNNITRALRFQHEFLQVNGKPCADNRLCGGGHDFSVNSRLLFHVVTDDLTSAIINDDTRFGNWAVIIRAGIPMLLVPAAFIGLALLAMVAIRAISRLVSVGLAHVLNRVTLAEIKREIYGNDTAGEIAVGVEPRPFWMQSRIAYLPPDVADKITEHANEAASASLAKFRNALSTIALSDGQSLATGVVSQYLTWKELIHTAYFELPEFLLLFARALVGAKGFAPTAAFASTAQFGNAERWLGTLVQQADKETAPKRIGQLQGAPEPS